MACLINSIDELPKVIEEIPDDSADMDAFFGDYTILANGKEILYDHAAYENSWYIYFVPKDESIDGELSILCALPSKEVFMNGHSGYFETLNSFSMCEKGSESETICGTPVCDESKEQIVITPTSTKIGNEYAGTSDKEKPTSVPQYSLYLELDTGKFYYYDNGEWNDMPCSGGGGGGETITWLLKDATATVAYDSEKEEYGAKLLFPASVTADNFETTFSGKSSVTEFNGHKAESPIVYTEGSPATATIYYWDESYGGMTQVMFSTSELYLFFYSDSDHEGQTLTFSLGIVEE